MDDDTFKAIEDYLKTLLSLAGGVDGREPDKLQMEALVGKFITVHEYFKNDPSL